MTSDDDRNDNDANLRRMLKDDDAVKTQQE